MGNPAMTFAMTFECITLILLILEQVNKISLDHNAAEHLNHEAKKLASRMGEDSKIIRINQRKLNLMLNQSTNGTSRVYDN